MVSSIKDGIDGATLANQIRLERATHMGSFLLVEGNSDAKLFGKFYDQQACSIIVCMGRDYLLNAISELEFSGFCGALGFADRDFSEFLSNPEFNGRVVFSDENDIEIMILCSSALDDLLQEFGVPDRVATIVESSGQMKVCDLIFDAASFVGTLRLLSHINSWSLSFEGMNYKYTDNNSYFLDEVKTIQHIVGRSNERPNLTERQILTHVKNFLSGGDDTKNLCCGHDCVRILGRALKSKFGKTNKFNNEEGAKSLERILRLTYDYEKFMQTKAYNEIRNWEMISGFKVLR